MSDKKSRPTGDHENDSKRSKLHWIGITAALVMALALWPLIDRNGAQQSNEDQSRSTPQESQMAENDSASEEVDLQAEGLDAADHQQTKNKSNDTVSKETTQPNVTVDYGPDPDSGRPTKNDNMVKTESKGGFFSKLFSRNKDKSPSISPSVQPNLASKPKSDRASESTQETPTETLVQSEVEIQEEADGCKVVTFKHQKIASHSDGEACTHHKNLLVLSSVNSQRINRNTICVKVNGKPVHHRLVKGSKDSIMIDSIAGPRAEITARFCTGKAICQETCKVPRDEFLDALGASDEKDYARWDESGPSKTEQELEKELRELNADLARRGRQTVTLFKGWMRGDSKPACENKVVMR